MKKTILFVTLLVVIISLSAVQVNQIANAGKKNKQVDFLDPNKISVIVCAVSNQKWTFHSKNYNSMASKGMVETACVHVMLGIKTGGPKIDRFHVQDIETKITLTSDKGNVIQSSEGTLYTGGHRFRSSSSTFQARIFGAFSDDVKSITVDGFITAKCFESNKEQTIIVPIEKATIKLAKAARHVRKAKPEN